MYKGALLLLAAGLPGLMTAAAPPALDQALARIRHNVEMFETQIPDFVCKEKITSRVVVEKDGSVEKQAVIESTFSGRQSHSVVNKSAAISFTEERQIESINGRKAKGSVIPDGVFHIGGGYSSLLVMIFGSQGKNDYSFSAAADAHDGPEGAYAIAFASKGNGLKIVEKDGAHSYKAAGRAWFDPVSFEILRLEEKIQPKGGDLGKEVPVVVEYKPVRIGENQFRLPSRVSATARRTVDGKAQRGEFAAEYSNYRKYGSESTLQFPDSDK